MKKKLTRKQVIKKIESLKDKPKELRNFLKDPIVRGTLFGAGAVGAAGALALSNLPINVAGTLIALGVMTFPEVAILLSTLSEKKKQKLKRVV